MFNELLQTRPRVLNMLHAIGVAAPATQTIGAELDCLVRHAAGKRAAIEVGTFQGVSARVIAHALDPAGKLYCVDPWAPIGSRENEIFSIAKRHFRRSGIVQRFVLLQGTSRTMSERLPSIIDFAFIDGDHSYDGLATDWAIIAPRIATGGIVCLHDTTIPPAEPERTHGSVRYFEDAIRKDVRFRHIETVHSLNVLQRLP